MQLTAGGLVQVKSYLTRDDYERLLEVAEEHERSIASEVRRGVRLLLALNGKYGEMRLEPAPGGAWLKFSEPAAVAVDEDAPGIAAGALASREVGR